MPLRLRISLDIEIQALDFEIQNFDRTGKERPGVDSDNEPLQFEDVLCCTPVNIAQCHVFGNEVYRPSN